MFAVSIPSSLQRGKKVVYVFTVLCVCVCVCVCARVRTHARARMHMLEFVCVFQVFNM